MAINARTIEKPKKQLKGIERAALLMLALGQENAKLILEDFADDEIKEISMAMSRLGAVDPEMIEETFVEFVQRMTAAGALMGSFDATERLLRGFLTDERVTHIMEEIRGPAGR